MRKLIILATVAPVALFAGGAIGQTTLPPSTGAAPSTGGGAGGTQPSTPQAAPDRPDATGGELGGTPRDGANTAQGDTQMPPGAGNAPQRNAQQPDAQQPGKANRSAQDATRTQDRAQGQNAQRSEPASKTGTAESGTTNRNKSTQTTNNTTTNNTNVNITSEKRTTIKQTITQTDVEPVRDVNFSVNVGVAIPQTVELHPLPPRVVEIVPQYRNYRYFVLADGRIVIVQPDTYKIVYVVA